MHLYNERQKGVSTWLITCLLSLFLISLIKTSECLIGSLSQTFFPLHSWQIGFEIISYQILTAITNVKINIQRCFFFVKLISQSLTLPAIRYFQNKQLQGGGAHCAPPPSISVVYDPICMKLAEHIRPGLIRQSTVTELDFTA